MALTVENCLALQYKYVNFSYPITMNEDMMFVVPIPPYNTYFLIDAMDHSSTHGGSQLKLLIAGWFLFPPTASYEWNIMGVAEAEKNELFIPHEVEEADIILNPMQPPPEGQMWPHEIWTGQ
ncbi:hypothetical protein VL2_gp091 [Pseudomonas phage vB_PaeM_VL12]|uniref:Uncharacterized protein n=11 Tax=Nankokuvirus TaxID=1925779 RepID=A0A218L423_9CAUD|nr:hypothetical protein [Pseudomonas aeruginosa]YP_004306814.1 hypothetical protein KPP10_gp065 [Pseudomonas phage KPP10]YP_008857703.1 hypothetical protein PAK_P30068 [Pseudomonas phage PAK_P3]YP_008858092.1 hypothetical protein X837_gp069 [Pseudomonas phage CHA_P1]YP_009206080.1 hypothetical protein AVT15_gp086 [Pseudomonas phage vB_PaeM_PS24]YP_009604746.1 hypothetical protein FDH93_gp119 [Pseudomonas phage vB_PaeM_G1]ADX32077.1 hypothetical protein P3_CHA0068 [Pseudomonas phage P3_CHA]QE